MASGRPSADDRAQRGASPGVSPAQVPAPDAVRLADGPSRATDDRLVAASRPSKQQRGEAVDEEAPPTELENLMYEISHQLNIRQFYQDGNAGEELIREVDDRIIALSKELAALAVTPEEIAQALEYIQLIGLDDRPEWRPKQTKLDAHMDKRWKDDLERDLLGCVDPSTVEQQTVLSPNLHSDLDDTIAELLKVSRVQLSLLREQYVRVGHWSFIQDTLLYDAAVGDDQKLEIWTYRLGSRRLRKQDEPTGSTGRPSAKAQPKEETLGMLRYRPREDALQAELWPAPAPGPRFRHGTKPRIVPIRAWRFRELRTRAMNLYRVMVEAFVREMPEFAEQYRSAAEGGLAMVRDWRWVEGMEKRRRPFFPTPGDSSRPRNLPRAVLVAPEITHTMLFEMDDTKVQALKRLWDRGRAVTFDPPRVHFRHGSASLDGPAQAELHAAAESVKQLVSRYGGGVRLLVTGHADGTGSTAFNDSLAERRAAVVTSALNDLIAGETVALLRHHGCGNGFAPDKARRPEHRVALIRVEPEDEWVRSQWFPKPDSPKTPR